ncbi:MAG: hypothetical protein HY710_16965 [Candidatus Latescibacteria bacterium]|nr:hypothetical protein [Candidatus Latescibacterota bacterium]
MDEVITPGTIINGAVNEVNPAGRMSHKASMTLTFDSITLVTGRAP